MFKSIDTPADQENHLNFPQEFLNLLDLPELAPHRLELKNVVPVMLLQNLDPPAITTDLVVKKMQNNLTECIILSGVRSGHSVTIPTHHIIVRDCSICKLLSERLSESKCNLGHCSSYLVF